MITDKIERNAKSEQLIEEAQRICVHFSHDDILMKYWDKISLILKGSTARGNADKYSDLDFVFYCSEKLMQQIIQEYYNAHRITRMDGIFVHLRKIGHYNFESLENLTTSYLSRDFIHIWETQNILVLHDPADQYTTLIRKLSEEIFSNHAEIIKTYYLQLQLTLDWMRHPLKRGDQGAVFLHCAKFTQLICQITFLLERKPYPPDKWLFYYLNTTSFGLQLQPLVEHYLHILNFGNQIKTGRDFVFYPQYRNAANLMKKLKKWVKITIGDHLWIQQWYNYV